MKYSRCLLGNYDHTVHFRNFWFNCYILLIKKMLCSLTWAAHVLCGGGAGCGIVLGLAQQAQVQDHQANTTNNTLHLVSSASNYIQQTVLCLFIYCRLCLISLIHVGVCIIKNTITSMDSLTWKLSICCCFSKAYLFYCKKVFP